MTPQYSSQEESQDDSEIENILNLEMLKAYNWLSANKLSLNVGKSCLLTFSPKKLTYQYFINNLKLPEIPGIPWCSNRF